MIEFLRKLLGLGRPTIKREQVAPLFGSMVNKHMNDIYDDKFMAIDSDE